VTRRDTAETFKDTIMIKDRAVEVTVICLNDMNVLNVQELAEKAWRFGEQGNHGRQVTVKVRAFRVVGQSEIRRGGR